MHNHKALDNFNFNFVYISLYFVLGMHFSLVGTLPALDAITCHPNIKVGGVNLERSNFLRFCFHNQLLIKNHYHPFSQCSCQRACLCIYWLLCREVDCLKE